MKYQAYVTASRGGLLIGGVKHHVSTPFETEQEANDWRSVVVSANCRDWKAATPSAWGWGKKVTMSVEKGGKDALPLRNTRP